MESASTQGEWAFRQRGWRRMVAEWRTREDARMKMEAMAHDGPRPSPSAAWTETLIISRRSNNERHGSSIFVVHTSVCDLHQFESCVLRLRVRRASRLSPPRLVYFAPDPKAPCFPSMIVSVKSMFSTGSPAAKCQAAGCQIPWALAGPSAAPVPSHPMPLTRVRPISLTFLV